MNSVYNDYDQNVDLRWDNDMYGHFQNEIAEFKRENVLPNKKKHKVKRKSSMDGAFLFRIFLWIVLILIIGVLVVKTLIYKNDSQVPDYPLVSLNRMTSFKSPPNYYVL